MVTSSGVDFDCYVLNIITLIDFCTYKQLVRFRFSRTNNSCSVTNRGIKSTNFINKIDNKLILL